MDIEALAKRLVEAMRDVSPSVREINGLHDVQIDGRFNMLDICRAACSNPMASANVDELNELTRKQMQRDMSMPMYPESLQIQKMRLIKASDEYAERLKEEGKQ